MEFSKGKESYESSTKQLTCVTFLSRIISWVALATPILNLRSGFFHIYLFKVSEFEYFSNPYFWHYALKVQKPILQFNLPPPHTIVQIGSGIVKRLQDGEICQKVVYKRQQFHSDIIVARWPQRLCVIPFSSLSSHNMSLWEDFFEQFSRYLYYSKHPPLWRSKIYQIIWQITFLWQWFVSILQWINKRLFNI